MSDDIQVELHPGSELVNNVLSLILPDGSDILIRLNRSGQIFIDQVKWKDTRRARRYIRALKESFEGRLRTELIVTMEPSTGQTRGYWIRWTPKEIGLALSNT